MHWGSASAARFRGSEPGVASAEPRVYGHTHKQGKLLLRRLMRIKWTVVHTVRRIDEVNDYLAHTIFLLHGHHTSTKFLVASPYTADRGVFR